MTAPKINRLSSKELQTWHKAKMRSAELRRIAEWALKHGIALDWENWGYCHATILRQFAPGRYREPYHEENSKLKVNYYCTWPACTPEAMLTPPYYQKHNLREELSDPRNLAELPRIIEAIERGIARSRKRRRTGFLSPDTVAEMLQIDRRTRDELKLRFIGAIDFKKAAREKARAEKNREDTRRRMREQRRREGRKQRSDFESESQAAVARRLGIKPATLRKRLQRERENSLKLTRRPPVTGVFDNNSKSKKVVSNTRVTPDEVRCPVARASRATGRNLTEMRLDMPSNKGMDKKRTTVTLIMISNSSYRLLSREEARRRLFQHAAEILRPNRKRQTSETDTLILGQRTGTERHK